MYLRLCYIIYVVGVLSCMFFFFKQKTAYDMRISDWSSDVCSSDLCFPRTHLALPRKRHSKIFTNVSATHCPSDSDLPHPSGEHGISRLRKRVNNFLRMATFGLVFRYLAADSGQLYSCHSISSLTMPKRCACPPADRFVPIRSIKGKIGRAHV